MQHKARAWKSLNEYGMCQILILALSSFILHGDWQNWRMVSMGTLGSIVSIPATKWQKSHNLTWGTSDNVLLASGRGCCTAAAFNCIQWKACHKLRVPLVNTWTQSKGNEKLKKMCLIFLQLLGSCYVSEVMHCNAVCLVCTVYTRLEARAFIYIERTVDPASIRDRRLFEAGLYCFQ